MYIDWTKGDALLAIDAALVHGSEHQKLEFGSLPILFPCEKWLLIASLMILPYWKQPLVRSTVVLYSKGALITYRGCVGSTRVLIQIGPIVTLESIQD